MHFKYMDLMFYIQYWIFKTAPCLSFCFSDKKEIMMVHEGKPPFESQVKYFDMLYNAFVYHMSIKRECVEALADRVSERSTLKTNIMDYAKNGGKNAW